MTDDCDDLIERQLNGTLCDEEAAALQVALKADRSLRLRYLDFANLDFALEAKAASARELLNAPYEVKAKQESSWLSSRSLVATGAGIVFGMVCTSVVFAYAVPRMKRDPQPVIALFSESFEDVKAVLGRGFPNDTGGWSGDFSAVIPAEASVSPKEGRHMAKLTPSAGRKFCAASRIVDLAEFRFLDGSESRTVEVTASFHGVGTEWSDRNQIRLAAFSESPQEVKAIWNGDGRLEQALLQLGRTVKTKPGEHGWQTIKVSMEIPMGTRSLVIHIGPGMADDDGPKTDHYIDDVRVQFVITESVP